MLTDPTLTDSAYAVSTTDHRPAPQLFVVLRCDALLAASSRHALSNIDEVIVGRGEVCSSERLVERGVRRLLLRIDDPRMSRAHAELKRTAQGWALRDLGSSNGTRVQGVRVDQALLHDGELIELGHTFLRFRAALPTPAGAPGDVRSDALGASPAALRSVIPALAAEFERFDRVARSSVPVVILGESGTGKELLARALHALSGRAGTFVGLNCGALPQSLLEAQLFGHIKGAFSGAARDELGFVRAADRGSLFLDEIGELPASSQAAMLRVLQEREVVPVGATRPVPVDLRVMCATHAALLERVQQGSFRDDLYARLAGFVFTAPALRERTEDFGLIIASLVPAIAQQSGHELRLHPESARRLLTYNWPRNIRELQQCLTTAAVLSADGYIEPAHIAAIVPLGDELQAPKAADAAQNARSDAELKQEILRQLTVHRGNITQVAQAMGKARVQIQRWLKRFAIDPASYR